MQLDKYQLGPELALQLEKGQESCLCPAAEQPGSAAGLKSLELCC